MWKYCHPCLENMQPNSLIDLEHINEDKNYIFKVINFNYNFDWVSSKGPEAVDDKEIQKKYYSTLTKETIYELYMKYKLDHELFGYELEPHDCNMGAIRTDTLPGQQ